MVAVVGRTGCGKSSLVRQLVGSRERVIILESADVKSEYPDARRFNSWADLVAALRVIEQKKVRKFRVSFCPGLGYFPLLLEAAWALGDVTLVIEEGAKYFPPDRPVPWQFIEVCERGRHAGPDAASPVSIIMVSQRPKRLPIVFRAELARLYAFRLNEKADRDWLAGFPGASKEIADGVSNLELFHYLNVDANGGITHETTRLG